MGDTPPETPMTDEQKDMCWEAANLIYRCMRVKVGVTRAYTAAVMWDELMRQHAKMFVPTLIRPGQVFMVGQLRAIAVQRLTEAQEIAVQGGEVEGVSEPPADVSAGGHDLHKPLRAVKDDKTAS
jgi:hypothetical protein